MVLGSAWGLAPDLLSSLALSSSVTLLGLWKPGTEGAEGARTLAAGRCRIRSHLALPYLR